MITPTTAKVFPIVDRGGGRRFLITGAKSAEEVTEAIKRIPHLGLNIEEGIFVNRIDLEEMPNGDRIVSIDWEQYW